MYKVPFNKPALVGSELEYIADSHKRAELSGDGYYTSCCHGWLEENTGSHKALLTHSGTAALEMAAILLNIQPGDEIILPSYTFVSTANAFVLRGAIPVFVDISDDTLNIDAALIEDAITKRTKAIVVVHYAGVACDMTVIMKIANRHNLFVVEDAAQAICSEYRGKPLGSIGHLGCFSFHETKNVISGEGGALLINQPELVERAEVIREKGTNRSLFFQGQVDKYTWVDLGSSYLPSEITAAFLWAQLQAADEITAARMKIWQEYHHRFEVIEQSGAAKRPAVFTQTEHNAHIYYLRLRNLEQRSDFIAKMRSKGIQCVFHYIPLHSSTFGKKIGRHSGNMSVTERVAETLVRLPLWLGLEPYQSYVIENCIEGLEWKN